MISVTHFAVGGGDLGDLGDSDFADRARRALDVLAACRGFVRGSVGRSTDDAGAWVIVCEWTNIGSYRRALGKYDVRMSAAPLLAQALDIPSAFEQLVDVDAAGTTTGRASDRAIDADTVDLTAPLADGTAR